MQNEECRMQNCGIPFGDDFKPCHRHTVILHFTFCILHFPIVGKVQKNNPIP